MSEPVRILVLGGGFGGMFAARALTRTAGGRVAVELVDEHNYFVFQPLLPEVAAGTLNPSDAVTPFRLLLPEVKINEGTVVAVDLAARRVDVVAGTRGAVRRIPYDHLVIALGTKVDLSRFPGLADHAFRMKDLADAFALRNHVIDCLEQADVADDPAGKSRLLTFVVVGGGLSGVETIGEIEDMITRALPFYPRIGREEVALVLAEHQPAILPELPPELAGYAGRALARRGVEVVTGAGVRSASAGAVELTSGRVIETATVVATIGNSPEPLVAGLPLPRERGRLVTDAFLRVTGSDTVWALGDCAWIDHGSNGAPVPPTAQAARQEAETLAANIRAALDGTALTPFAYRARGQLASLGGRRGVAEVFGFQIVGAVAWLLWRSTYLALLPGRAFKIRVALDWLLDILIPRNLVQIAQGCRGAVRQERFRAGDTVYRRGDWAQNVYLVETGSFQRTPEGGGADTILGPGDIFGEGGGLRRATVRALDVSTCLVLDRGDTDRLFAIIDRGASPRSRLAPGT